MRHFLKRVPFSVSNRKWLLRATAVASVAGSALVYSDVDSDYRTGMSLAIPAFASDVLSTPWRSELLSLGPLASGKHQTHVCNVASSQGGGGSSEPSSSNPKHDCQCLGRDTITNAAAKVGPAVVNLSVPQGFHGLTMGKSMGSGTIIDPDGTILTCAHVVVDFQGMKPLSKGKVEVTLQDGRAFEGTVLHADLHSDVAIVKIKSKLPLPAAKFGSSSKLRPGDWVISLGCPLSLQNTVTAGIVSCVDRKSSDLGIGGMRREYLQTDCAINPGNSGGPLVNMDGEVVGVNIMKVYAADGLSFAVPIDSVSTIIEHFKKSGRVIRPWIGLEMIDPNEMIIAQLKDRDPTFPNVDRGVLVPMVTPGSPADHAGFRPGDVVIVFDGRPVQSIKEIIEIMGDKVGVPLKVVVKRANDVVVNLLVTPEEANPYVLITRHRCATSVVETQVIGSYHRQFSNDVYYDEFLSGEYQNKCKPGLKMFVSKTRELCKDSVAKEFLWWRGLARVLENKGLIRDMEEERSGVHIRLPELTQKGMKYLECEEDEGFWVYPEADMLLAVAVSPLDGFRLGVSAQRRGWADPETRKQRLEMRRANRKPRKRKRDKSFFQKLAKKYG